MKKTAIIFFILIICAILLVFIRKNTALLTFNPPKDQITNNNFNNTSSPSKKPEKSQVNLNELKPQDITVSDADRTLYLPQNFKITVFAAGFTAPRSLDFDENGNIYVTDKGAGIVYFVSHDGSKKVLDSNLRNIHGINWYKNNLYVAEENQVNLYKNVDQEKYQSKEVIIKNLPSGIGHNTRTIHVSPDKKIYLSIGSSCNVCEESNDKRAAILTYNLDGSNEKIFATGLRNTVGFTFKQAGGSYEVWGVDNGRDRIGDNIPVDEVNIIKNGKNYGWPYCRGSGIPNPEYPDRENYCRHNTEFPQYSLQAHSAPLGLDFVPQDYAGGILNNNLLIAFHGSWNRTIPTGYKIVRIDTSDQQAQTVNFITGWLLENGQAWGRPVDIQFNNGDIYITDDRSGVIYKVTYQNND